jgi:nucleoside-diphosphate-sugar epimerase
MKIALTGATGLVGRRTVEELTLAGHDVRCLVRPAHAARLAPAPKVELVVGDLGDAASLADLAGGCAVIVHAAVWHEGPMNQVGRELPREHYEKNVMASLTLLELARDANQQFIFISSGSVFGDPPGNDPLRDDYPRAPTDAYGSYKAAVEMFCHSHAAQFGVNACVLRPFRILGVHDRASDSPFHEVIQCVLQGDELRLSKGFKSVLVEDVARAIAFVAGRADVKGQAYNLCDGFVSQQQIARLAIEASGSGARLVDTPQITPRHQALADGIQSLGFSFGGVAGLARFVRALIASTQDQREIDRAQTRP